jgi:hypothetical protein
MDGCTTETRTVCIMGSPYFSYIRIIPSNLSTVSTRAAYKIVRMSSTKLNPTDNLKSAIFTGSGSADKDLLNSGATWWGHKDIGLGRCHLTHDRVWSRRTKLNHRWGGILEDKKSERPLLVAFTTAKALSTYFSFRADITSKNSCAAVVQEDPTFLLSIEAYTYLGSVVV